jgi:glyoxylase-like metal-dependent hydrolase (beta-lactamase superfamily II)
MEILKDLHAFLWLDPGVNNCNTYFINGGKRILIDPGHAHLLGNVRSGLERLALSTREIDLIVLTHGHPDHVEGIRAFERNGTSVALHSDELPLMRKIAALHPGVAGLVGLEPDILLREGEMRAGDLTLQVIQTPGHSPGSISLYWPERKVLFTGDTVFHQGVGRTDLPGGSGEMLKESIRRLSLLDVDILLPGHGPIVSGPEMVKATFAEIQEIWFNYL